MKLHKVKSQNGFSQTTFYSWLREEELITKLPSGYVVGPKALPGMETLTSKRVNEDGEVIEITQVTIDKMMVPELVQRYTNSGKENLYVKRKSVREKYSESELANRLEILENRLILMEKQLAGMIQE